MDEVEFYFDESKFMSRESIAEIIERYVSDEGLNHFEAVIAFCEENNKEFEEMVRMFGPTLLEKIKQAARDMGLMPQEPKLEGM